MESQRHNGVVIDRRGDGRTDYPLPGGGVMPVPRSIDQSGGNAGRGLGSDGSTQDTGRIPSHPVPQDYAGPVPPIGSHPALSGGR